MIKYRKIEASESPQIAELYRVAGWIDSSDNTDFILKTMENCHWVGCFDEDVLVGMARAICDHASDGYIQDVVVIPTYRRRGIASEIIRLLIDLMEAEGVDWIGLIGVPGTCSLYSQCGFASLEGHVAMRYIGKK